MLTDTRILQRHSGYEVLAECQAVRFPDNHAVQLHDVRRRGIDDMFLRACLYGKSQWCVFDLRTVHRKFAVEIPLTLHRDRPGLVLYMLRAEFPSTFEFFSRVSSNLESTWTTDVELRRATDGFTAGAITFQPELRSHA